MRKLPPEERLKHSVIVLLKKKDYESLKAIAAVEGMTQGAFARDYVLRGVERKRKVLIESGQPAPELKKSRRKK